MTALPNFPLAPNTSLAQELLAQGIPDFHSAIHYIQHMPYGRNRERANPMLVITEKKGTCSSKHACLKQIAVDQHQTAIQLVIGIYRMNTQNTPGIGGALEKAGLSYIPEAHCYLKYEGLAYDFTNPSANFERLAADILEEKVIEAADVGVYKVNYHRAFIDRWREKAQIPYDLEQIWSIREACIESLSQ